MCTPPPTQRETSQAQRSQGRDVHCVIDKNLVSTVLSFGRYIEACGPLRFETALALFEPDRRRARRRPADRSDARRGQPVNAAYHDDAIRGAIADSSSKPPDRPKDDLDDVRLSEVLSRRPPDAKETVWRPSGTLLTVVLVALAVAAVALWLMGS